MHQRRTCFPCSGQGGDHDIAKDCTAQFVEGWDWIVPVPDRNTGIWDDVDIRWTGPVLLQVLLMTHLTINAGDKLRPLLLLPASGGSASPSNSLPSESARERLKGSNRAAG